jgi:hypothetical protein
VKARLELVGLVVVTALFTFSKLVEKVAMDKDGYNSATLVLQLVSATLADTELFGVPSVGFSEPK